MYIRINIRRKIAKYAMHIFDLVFFFINLEFIIVCRSEHRGAVSHWQDEIHELAGSEYWMGVCNSFLRAIDSTHFR